MFDNDDPNQRERLVQALESNGLDGREFCSGGGVVHIVVPLLDGDDDPPSISAQDPKLYAYLEGGLKAWPHPTCLYVATNSLRTTCDVGLMGNDGRTGDQLASAEWKHADSIGEAVSIFAQIWQERDAWLRRFIAGELAV